ncbi:hypothetical protein AB434_3360 [Heyndrickxia coagulans]|uniref:Uncharacterized protein n=1 Tax=Heyndrickxia coagulans TaxID=1398 RepID=A0AAN0T6W4_HEYCO|nr:hypothetical protein SB48_HM08orf03043 [Heyndrickxia coagulans]AKN55765.1 hypothetical protein AB434_3360 [Heyndrickxia coagulans]
MFMRNSIQGLKPGRIFFRARRVWRGPVFREHRGKLKTDL